MMYLQVSHDHLIAYNESIKNQPLKTLENIIFCGSSKW